MKQLTQHMAFALSEAKASGAAIAGRSCDRRGRVQNIAGSTIRALCKLGLMTSHTSPDGYTMGRLTKAGLDSVTLIESGNALLARIGMKR